MSAGKRRGRDRDLAGEQSELRATTAERLEAIVEAAERAAEGVIDDAEAQARRYLAQARAEADRATEGRVAELSELVDSLLGQAISLRQEAERLQAALEEAKARVASEAPAQRPQEPAEQPRQHEAPRLRAVGEREEPGADEQSRRADAAGARLLATQMAVSGSSREEIELRLRNGFEIEDTAAILDAILGPED
jgi:cell division septum initiation protein DivIVA